MSQHYRVEKAIDPAIGRRLLVTRRTGDFDSPDAAARTGMVAESAGARACVYGKRLDARRALRRARTG